MLLVKHFPSSSRNMPAYHRIISQRKSRLLSLRVDSFICTTPHTRLNNTCKSLAPYVPGNIRSRCPRSASLALCDFSSDSRPTPSSERDLRQSGTCKGMIQDQSRRGREKGRGRVKMKAMTPFHADPVGTQIPGRHGLFRVRNVVGPPENRQNLELLLIFACAIVESSIR